MWRIRHRATAFLTGDRRSGLPGGRWQMCVACKAKVWGVPEAHVNIGVPLGSAEDAGQRAVGMDARDMVYSNTIIHCEGATNVEVSRAVRQRDDG